MYRLDRFQLKSYYEEVTALKVNKNDIFPQYFCYECAMMLHKFHKFKEKCYCAMKALKDLMWKGSVTQDSLSKLDRSSMNLMPILQYVNNIDNIRTYNFKGTDPQNEPRLVKSEEDNNVLTEETFLLLDASETDPVAVDDNVQQTVFIDIKKEEEEEKEKEIEMSLYNSITKRRTRFLDASNWKKYNLTEERAMQEFRGRFNNNKYLKAAYKCTSCFKGFSKQEMLGRHFKLRHALSLGNYECRFCKMRFKWDSHLRIHMQQHFTKYQCLRCSFVCNLENSAVLHEEYHSGIVRKCIHCNYEFKHASTYYTHLRTVHRSEHICAHCGVSFVSEAGLQQHKKVKHCDESLSDDNDEHTFCERCDMQFSNRKAFVEHLFHSMMHADGVEHEIKDELTIPRKVLGKRIKGQVVKSLNQRMDEFSPNSKCRRWLKRDRCKPTTCYQCGEHFDTQAACMKHHLSEHRGTSFYPDSARHICEICGASLAPSSVAIHQNMHTKEKIFSCDVCGREFHSSVGLKRHSVTHTGEKRYGCSLCEKRFTQSNSMKLHFRTFHLKQPYPKRNRRKEAQESICSFEDERSELESLPEQNPPPLEPQTVIMEHPTDNVQYLTLD